MFSNTIKVKYSSILYLDHCKVFSTVFSEPAPAQCRLAFTQSKFFCSTNLKFSPCLKPFRGICCFQHQPHRRLQVATRLGAPAPACCLAFIHFQVLESTMLHTHLMVFACTVLSAHGTNIPIYVQGFR